MKPKFTVRDLLLLTLAIGIACAWWGHYQQLSAELEELRAKSKHIEAAQQQVIAYKTVMDDLRDQHSQLRSVAADLWQLLEDSHVKIPQDVEQRYLILQKKHFAPGHNP